MSAIKELYIQYMNSIGMIVTEDKVNDFISKVKNSEQISRYLKILINNCNELQRNRMKARHV